MINTKVCKGLCGARMGYIRVRSRIIRGGRVQAVFCKHLDKLIPFFDDIPEGCPRLFEHGIATGMDKDVK